MSKLNFYTVINDLYWQFGELFIFTYPLIKCNYILPIPVNAQRVTIVINNLFYTGSVYDQHHTLKFLSSRYSGKAWTRYYANTAIWRKPLGYGETAYMCDR